MTNQLKQKGNPLIERVDTLIDERANNIEHSKTLVSNSTKRVLMAGFSFEEATLPPTEVAEKATQVKNKAVDYLKRKLYFATELNSAGISYKAILPTKLFNQLCKEFGLIRFEYFNEEGKVCTNKTRAQIHERLGIGTFLPAAILCLIAVSFGIAYAYAMGTVATIALAIVAVGAGFSIWRLNVTRMGHSPKFIQWLFGEVSTKNSNPAVLALFPPLPKELAPIMQSLKPLHQKGRLFTAALPEAVKVQIGSVISLAEGAAVTEKIARKAEEAAIAEERAERIRQRLINEEPIVYSLSADGNLVAAHFQFGEFPREKEFMERIQSITDAELFSLV